MAVGEHDHQPVHHPFQGILMARFVIIAHEAEFSPPAAGIRFLSFRPYEPIFREEFEATKLCDIQSRFDQATDHLRTMGKSFAATLVHVRHSGRKPAGFDRARFRVEHETSATPASAEVAA